MSMVTSCPSCATTFRVTTEQLKARSGRVRCGQCRTVFDGFKALASIPDEPIPDTIAPPPASGTQPAAAIEPVHEAAPLSPTSLGVLDFDFAAAGAPPAVAPPAADVPAAAVPVAPTSATPIAAALAEPEPLPLFAELPPPVARSATAASPAAAPAASRRNLRALGPDATDDAPPPAWHRAAGIAAIVLLSLALVVQALHFFRGGIVAAAPVLKPVVLAACAITGCTLAPPQNTEALTIVASDLQADPTRQNVIVLTAALRNRAPSAVAYPALELTLTNPQDQTIARRVILARDYVAAGTDTAAGMPSDLEIPIKLSFDTGDLRPSGYRLYLFYP